MNNLVNAEVSYSVADQAITDKMIRKLEAWGKKWSKGAIVRLNININYTEDGSHLLLIMEFENGQIKRRRK